MSSEPSAATETGGNETEGNGNTNRNRDEDEAGAETESGAGDIDDVSVVGAGTMGYGIALAYATGGCEVRLYDVDDDAVERAKRNVRSGLDSLAAVGRLTETESRSVADRIGCESDFERAVAGSDLVTEAVPEDVELKRETFARLDEHAPAEAILATNTSGLSITEISTAVSDPSRVVGTHWFNPAHVVPGVEVIRGERTANETTDRTTALLERVGKTPIVVERDIRGFIGNRLQLAMAYEAFSLLDRGVADAETIDRAARSTFGFRLPASGVFEKVDQSGLDVQADVTEYLLPDLDRGTDPHEVLSALVREGNLGTKTGRGIYDWSDRDLDELNAERDRELLALLDAYESNAAE